MATAASIYCTLGEPVFPALDAYNLYPVAKNLKVHYPQKEIIVWADKVWQKAENLGNTGLIMAHSAVFKLRNARVACPDFSMLAEDIKKEASDFTDLYQQLGESAIFTEHQKKSTLQQMLIAVYLLNLERLPKIKASSQ